VALFLSVYSMGLTVVSLMPFWWFWGLWRSGCYGSVESKCRSTWPQCGSCCWLSGHGHLASNPHDARMSLGQNWRLSGFDASPLLSLCSPLISSRNPSPTPQKLAVIANRDMTAMAKSCLCCRFGRLHLHMAHNCWQLTHLANAT